MTYVITVECQVVFPACFCCHVVFYYSPRHLRDTFTRSAKHLQWLEVFRDVFATEQLFHCCTSLNCDSHINCLLQKNALRFSAAFVEETQRCCKHM